MWHYIQHGFSFKIGSFDFTVHHTGNGEWFLDCPTLFADTVMIADDVPSHEKVRELSLITVRNRLLEMANILETEIQSL